MTADADRKVVLLGQLHSFANTVDRPGLHQAVRRHSPHIQGNRTGIDLLLDVLLQTTLALARVDSDMRDELHVSAALAIVPLDKVGSALEYRIDPVLFSDLQCLQDLLLVCVGAKQGVNILQVPRVHVPGNEIAAKKQSAYLCVADPAARDRFIVGRRRWSRGFRVRLSRPGDAFRADARDTGRASGGQRLIQEITTTDILRFGHPLSFSASVFVPR